MSDFGYYALLILFCIILLFMVIIALFLLQNAIENKKYEFIIFDVIILCITTCNFIRGVVKVINFFIENF